MTHADRDRFDALEVDFKKLKEQVQDIEDRLRQVAVIENGLRAILSQAAKESLIFVELRDLISQCKGTLSEVSQILAEAKAETSKGGEAGSE